jgi:YidC/Oxa1 family membrane protein insertase
MDKNTITGLLLIFVILTGSYLLFNKPTPPKNNKVAIHDSVIYGPEHYKDTVATAKLADTSKSAVVPGVPMAFQAFAKGEDKDVTLENNDLIVKISAKGGRVSYVELKKYKTYDGKPLLLTKNDVNEYNYQFSAGTETLNTKDLYFTPSNVTRSSVEMTVNMPGGKAIKQIYSLPNDGYLVNNELDLVAMNDIIPRKDSYIDLNWSSEMLRQEKDTTASKNNTTIYYRNVDETPTYLSETKDANEKFKKETDWVSFKQHFFAQTLISKEHPFINADLTSEFVHKPGSIKKMTASLTLPYEHKEQQNYKMQFYFGPLSYKVLDNMNMGLERQIPLGWGFFLISFVNRFIILNIFNLLTSFMTNMGLVIIVMTIIIKLIVMPFTYKSFLSTAKMRILKPELDELKEKFGGEATKLQAEQMKLYRKAGVSPFGGCLPLLLQAPFLFAMFRFFPSSIELRQQAFLWAKDLSTYDSIYNLPFNIPFYGDHVSLFTLLMTASTLIYTRMNNSLSPQQNEFKYLSYIMPIVFLGIFNNYSAGLSLYYFGFNILTFGQQYAFKLFINEDKLKAQIEENKKKQPSNKKSGLQRRLEDIQKRQQEMQRQQRSGGTSQQKPTRRK